jgi:hypothetical protein
MPRRSAAAEPDRLAVSGLARYGFTQCRTSDERIEKYCASHIATSRDAAAVDVRKSKRLRSCGTSPGRSAGGEERHAARQRQRKSFPWSNPAQSL